MNVTNNRMLRWPYEIRSFHLNKFYPLPFQIRVFGKLMHSMARLVCITAKLNDTALYHYEEMN